MLRIKIICVGKMKENYFKEACNEYIKRCSTVCNLEIIEIKEALLPQEPSQAEIDIALKKEETQILKRLKEDKFIAMCIEGRSFSSEEFAKNIDKMIITTGGKLSFVIGSSYGLSAGIKKKACMQLSMSSMTFAHRLACVMLCEQIYRALNILNKGKYNK